MVSISETKIDSMIEDSVIEIEDYVVERSDRNKHGGGVAMYIHKSIDNCLRKDLLRSDIESISIQVKLGNYKPFIVTSLYRPPGKTVAFFMNWIICLAHQILRTRKPFILVTQITATTTTIIDHNITDWR